MDIQEIKNKVSKANQLTPFSLNEVEYLLKTIKEQKKEIERLNKNVEDIYEIYADI